MERKKPGPGRRLALNKETLRTLGDADLQGAAGAGTFTIVGSVLTSVVTSMLTVTSSVILTPGPKTKTNPPAPDPEPEPEPETETP